MGAMLKKAHQRLYPLWCIRCLMNFYRGTMESVLAGGVTVWYGNATAHDSKAIQSVIRMVEKIFGCALPSIEIFWSRCRRKASSIIQDHNHPSHQLFSLLRSGRRFRSIRTRTQLRKEKRQSIITLRHEGKSIWKMSRTLNVSSSAVTKTIKCYDETGSHEDRPRKGRPNVTSAAEHKFITVTSLRNRQ